MRFGLDHPAGPTRPRTDVRSAWLAAACLAAIGLAVLVGVWAGRTVAPGRPAPPAVTRSVQAGAARLVVPNDWQTVPSQSAGIAGLEPAATAVLAPYSGVPARVIVTIAPIDDASLLPGPLRPALGGPTASPENTSLAGQRAWLYSGLRIGPGHRIIDVTVLPSSAGVLAVACVSPEAWWVASGDCAASVQAVSVRAATLVPSPDLALELRLPRVLATLNAVRVRARAALRQARTPADQERLALDLARAHQAAATSLRPLAAGVAGLALSDQLSSTAGAYSRLALAARAGPTFAFANARRAVEHAEAGLARALASVAARGGTAPLQHRRGQDSVQALG